MPITKMRTRWINGNLIYYSDADGYQRWLDAQGPDVRKLKSDFQQPTITGGELLGWTATAVEAGTGTSDIVAQTDVEGGAIRLNAAANENDGVQIQNDGAFKMTSSDKLYFGARWNISEITQSDAFIGLAVTDTTILAGNPDDMIGFIKADASSTLNYIVRKNGTGSATTTGSALVADTFVVTEFYWNGSTVYLYLDGALVASTSTNVPNDVNLRVSLCYLNGAGSQQNDGVEVNWVRCFQLEG